MSSRRRKKDDGVEIFGKMICWAIILPFMLIYWIIKEISLAAKTGQKKNKKSEEYHPIQYVEQDPPTSMTKFSDMSGYDFEQYCAVKLKEMGYTRIVVTPKSGDYGADIIAFHPEKYRVCFQCKKYKRPVGVKAVQEIHAAKGYYNCDKAAVITNAEYTAAAYELAKSLDVELLVVRDPIHRGPTSMYR